MTEDTKQYIQWYLSILKQAMKNENMIFGIMVDKEDANNSRLCFVDKEQYFKGKHDGITISLEELNRDLL